jgi:ATP-dependent Lon protease
MNDQPLSASSEETITTERPARTGASPRALPDDALIILPARNVVMFPGLVIPMQVGRERSRMAVQEALRLEKPIGILLQTGPSIDEPVPTSCTGSARARSCSATSPRPTACTTRSSRASSASACCSSSRLPVRGRARAVDRRGRRERSRDPGRARSLKQRASEVLQLLPGVPEEMATRCRASRARRGWPTSSPA